MTSKIEWTDVLRARFWSYVDLGGPGECWPWRRGLFTNGYGQFRVGKRKVKAHRCAYELSRGTIPPGLRVLHSCDNPPCCNPDHLFTGTAADNAHDRDGKGRTRNGYVSLPGESNPSAKLSQMEVDRIRELHNQGCTQRDIAEEFEMSQSQIGNIVRGDSWA